MAVTSGFYNSVSGDRKYNALQMSSIFDGIIEDGVYSTIGDHFSVTAGTGNTVIVGTGRAWFNHTWTLNDADYPVTLEPSEVVLNRYDAIVIEVNGSNAVRGNSIKVIKGTPGSSPSKPSLAKGDSNIWQHPLAYVYVPAGSSSISQSNIEYVVGKSECPFVVAAVQSVNIDALVAQWQDEFDTWFDNLEYQLSGDVAGNLQNQINQKADKANIIDNPDDLLANQATGMIAGAKAVSVLNERMKTQNILWQGEYYMAASHTANLNQPISEQKNGVVLVFSAYRNGTSQDYDFNSFFVPKKLIELKSQHPHAFLMARGNFDDIACKYLYIYDNRIVGTDMNTLRGTGTSGIKYNNEYYVLRYALGV